MIEPVHWINSNASTITQYTIRSLLKRKIRSFDETEELFFFLVWRTFYFYLQWKRLIDVKVHLILFYLEHSCTHSLFNLSIFVHLYLHVCICIICVLLLSLCTRSFDTKTNATHLAIKLRGLTCRIPRRYAMIRSTALGFICVHCSL